MIQTNKLTNKSFHIIRDKYNIEILICLFIKPSRFSEIKKRYNYINQQILSKNIKQLLDKKIIEILINNKTKEKKFSLTEKGKKLKRPLKAIIEFEIYFSKTIEKKDIADNKSLYDFY